VCKKKGRCKREGIVIVIEQRAAPKSEKPRAYELGRPSRNIHESRKKEQEATSIAPTVDSQRLGAVEVKNTLNAALVGGKVAANRKEPLLSEQGRRR